MASDRVTTAPPAAVAIASLSLVALSVVLLALVGRPLATDDLWWHMKLGEVYANEGPWVEADPLYHTTQDRPTVPHEWLFQVGVHALDRGVGFQGLRALHVLLVAAIGLLSWRALRRVAPDPASAALATMVLLTLSWFRLFQWRPDLASVLCLLALEALLLRDESPPGARRIAAALAVFVLWVNVHSLFLIGLALLLAALLGVALRRLLLAAVGAAGDDARTDRRRGGRLAVALVLAFLLAGLNPRGFEAHTLFFAESASGDIWHLEDDFLPWNPFVPTPDNPALTFLCWLLADALGLAFLAAAGAGLLRVWRERSAAAVWRLDCVGLGLSAAALVAMAVSVRFHWLALFPLLYLLRALAAWQRASARPPARAAWAAAAACAALALAFPGGIHLGAFAREVAAEPDGYRSPYLDERYCGAGVRFLADADLHGRLFHPFNLGGFLGYWLAPRLRTFIDGRMDHYPSDVLEDYLKIRRASQVGATAVMDEILDARGVDVVFAPAFPESRYPDWLWITHFRRLPGWTPVFATRTHTIFLRRHPDNQRNFTRVRAYYRQRNLPFDARRGVDVAEVIRRRPAWAEKQGMVPPGYATLLEEAEHPDVGRRVAALDALGDTYWRIGAFAEQEAVDRELVALVPEAPAPRRRLADALLHLDRPREALALAEALHAEDPRDAEAAALAGFARGRLEREAEREAEGS